MKKSSTPSISRDTNRSAASPKRVMVFGTFSLLHPGHKYLIRTALRRGNLTIVVARDASVLRMKGRLPQDDEQARLRALQESFPTATVQLGDATDYLRPVRMVRPDIIVLGYDQRLPPGISAADLDCVIARSKPFRPKQYKSSLLARQGIVRKG